MQALSLQMKISAVGVMFLLVACGQEATRSPRSRAPVAGVADATPSSVEDPRPTSDPTVATAPTGQQSLIDGLLKSLGGLGGGNAGILSSLQGLLNNGQSGLVAGSLQGILSGGDPNAILNQAKQVAGSGGLESLLGNLNSSSLLSSLGGLLSGTNGNPSSALSNPSLQKIEALIKAGDNQAAQAELQSILNSLQASVGQKT